MKRAKVSALRERGVRRLCDAEPQCCEPKFKQPIERKADTIKTYVLRPFHPVEPQYCRRTDPTTRAITSDILSRPAAPSTDLILYVGMDVHNDSIAVAIARSRSTEKKWGQKNEKWGHILIINNCSTRRHSSCRVLCLLSRAS